MPVRWQSAPSTAACVLAARGNSYKSKAAAQDLARPIRIFAADRDSLTYTVAGQRWTVRAMDGSPLRRKVLPETQHIYEVREDKIAAEVDPKTGTTVAKHPILWRPFTFRLDGPRLYAFTADGHAYAMGPQVRLY